MIRSLQTLLLTGLFIFSLNASAQSIQLSDSDKFFQDESFEISLIHPNPSNGQVSLHYSFKQNTDERYKLVFHNVLGVKVAEYEVLKGQNSLSVSLHHLKSGVYFYTLIKDEEKQATRKFMLK